MKKLLFILLFLCLIGCQDNQVEAETSIVEDHMITFPSTDGLTVTAENYFIDEHAPIFILFHKAGWSRGEFNDTALKLNEMGYNAIAVDLRSGLEVNDTINETAQLASTLNFERNHTDAAKDIIGTLDYVYSLYDNEIYLLGSSFSASLLLTLESSYTDQIKGIFAFSPGEYFTYDGKSIAYGSKTLKVPVFITSASYELDEWENIYDNIGSENKFAFYPEAFGEHGSESLWEETEGQEEYWEAMTIFLDTLKETD